MVDAEHRQSAVGRLSVDTPVPPDRGEVPHPAEQPVCDPGCPAAPFCYLIRSIGGDRDLHDPGASLHDLREIGNFIEVEAEDEPEPVAERGAEQPDLRRGADEGELLQRELDRPCTRPLADHHVDAGVLHRRVEDLLDHRVEAMDLVDEENVAVGKGGQLGGEVAGPFQHRSGGAPDPGSHLARDDLGERRLPEARWAGEEDVVERLAAFFCGGDGDGKSLLDLRLAHELVEARRPDRRVVGFTAEG